MAAEDDTAGAANSVLGKARLILESFDLDVDRLTLTEIAARTGLSKATVFRLNRELLEWGMLERAGLQYRLGMRAFELGSRVPRFRVLRDAARPYMESLHIQTHETVHLAVLDGLEVLYLEKVASMPQAARPSRIAGRLPLHSTATGKVLLAFGQPSLVEEVVARGALQRVTPKTVVLPGVLLDQLRRARRDGYATELEETTAGYCSVAVPIFGASGLLLASLSLTTPVVRADLIRHAAVLRAVSQKVSAQHAIN
ncbi:DNA-binding IclR family transcriptional regulator [Mycobacterium frederiksbergense]|uniref:DNA-binding IclR family transcriptional regulator n=1 Tax=Mycolicibacterium frederiksbergense TaxID=117567 RepID=A0ABT6L593_9MYCO|nr:IclR family transcriptional regulator [Mycolicibacterium frederiksbergense]MDH6198105.1 DNA-binding IclR family transcriptional regulator [Mycolicibacterium frederiksbergense]